MDIIYLKTGSLLKNVAGLKTIDKDKQQLDNYEKRPPVSFPCALITVSTPKRSSIGGSQQICFAQIRVRVAFDLMVSETSMNAPQASLERSLAPLDLVRDVFKELQGYSDGEVEPYDCVSQVEESRKDGYTVFNLMFTTNFIDDASV